MQRASIKNTSINEQSLEVDKILSEEKEEWASLHDQ